MKPGQLLCEASIAADDRRCCVRTVGTRVIDGVPYGLCGRHSAESRPRVVPPDVIEREDVLGPSDVEATLTAMPAARRFAWFEAPPGWSDEAWRASVTAALGELANWRDDVRDKRMRPWLYEPERSDPSLKRILDKLDEMNRRARGRPTLVALAHEAGISDRHIQRVLRRYGLSWKRTRDYRHT